MPYLFYPVVKEISPAFYSCCITPGRSPELSRYHHLYKRGAPPPQSNTSKKLGSDSTIDFFHMCGICGNIVDGLRAAGFFIFHILLWYFNKILHYSILTTDVYIFGKNWFIQNQPLMQLGLISFLSQKWSYYYHDTVPLPLKAYENSL